MTPALALPAPIDNAEFRRRAHAYLTRVVLVPPPAASGIVAKPVRAPGVDVKRGFARLPADCGDENCIWCADKIANRKEREHQAVAARTNPLLDWGDPLGTWLRKEFGVVDTPVKPPRDRSGQGKGRERVVVGLTDDEEKEARKRLEKQRPPWPPYFIERAEWEAEIWLELVNPLKPKANTKPPLNFSVRLSRAVNTAERRLRREFKKRQAVFVLRQDPCRELSSSD